MEQMRQIENKQQERRFKSIYIPTTLNVNGLYIPSGRLSGQVKLIRFPPETYFKFKDTGRLKVKECEKIQPENNNQKKAGVTILT